MIALVKTQRGDGHLALQERPEPDVRPGTARIRVVLAGLCGTDLHILHDEFPYWPPVVLGHEFTGVVEAVGPDVPEDLVGRRVVAEPHAGACGVCGLCRRGVAELCERKRSPGWGVDGAFARSVVLPAHLLHAVPDSLPDEVAVLTEPTAIGVTALLRSRVDPGDTVLVVGPGPVGILAAIAAEAMGAATVIVAGRRDSARLAFARRAGLLTVSTAAEALAAVRDASAGRGADLVVEASGDAGAVSLAIEAVRRRGRIAAIGIGRGGTIPVPWDLAISRAAEIAFSSSSSHSAWAGAIDILRRHHGRLAGFGTVFPLHDWEAAFAAAADRAVVKVLLDPSEARA